MSRYLDETIQRFPQLSVCRDDVAGAFALMRDSFRAGGKLLVCGNGGSAADSEHITGELLKGFYSKRPLSSDERARVGAELADVLQGGLPAIPLTGFMSLTSAFGNDVAAEAAFAQLTWALGRKGDVLLGISTSGNARNVLMAFQAARAAGMAVIGLSGKTGARMAAAADVCIRVPETSTPLIQELHLPVYHCLCGMLEEVFFGRRAASAVAD
ncbi:MAG: SIS domain-containing protein [bacterium]|nr:SIS domain-containing protein [Candidatus Sumerlaeota bacterium]